MQNFGNISVLPIKVKNRGHIFSKHKKKDWKFPMPKFKNYRCVSCVDRSCVGKAIFSKEFRSRQAKNCSQKTKFTGVTHLEWDIQNVLKNVFGKIVEAGFNEDGKGKHADIYLKNLLNPLKDYIYRFWEVVDAKQILPRDYQLFSQFMTAIADIFVGVEAFLSGVLDRVKLLNLLQKNEKTLLASDASSLFLAS